MCLCLWVLFFSAICCFKHSYSSKVYDIQNALFATCSSQSTPSTDGTTARERKIMPQQAHTLQLHGGKSHVYKVRYSLCPARLICASRGVEAPRVAVHTVTAVHARDDFLLSAFRAVGRPVKTAWTLRSKVHYTQYSLSTCKGVSVMWYIHGIKGTSRDA